MKLLAYHQPPEQPPSKVIRDLEPHYMQGGIRHATGKYDRDIDLLNKHIEPEVKNPLVKLGQSVAMRPPVYKNRMQVRRLHMTQGITLKSEKC